MVRVTPALGKGTLGTRRGRDAVTSDGGQAIDRPAYSDGGSFGSIDRPLRWVVGATRGIGRMGKGRPSLALAGLTFR